MKILLVNKNTVLGQVEVFMKMVMTRLVKWLVYYDRSYYKNLKHYHLMASVSTCLNELS